MRSWVLPVALCCAAVFPALVPFSTASVAAPLSAVQSDDPHPGRAPYDRVCKVCHGDEGGGNAGPALVPFTLSGEELLIKVREGGGEMPPISANRLSDAEVEQIAAYLTSLTPPDRPASAVDVRPR